MVEAEALQTHLSALPGPRYRSTDGEAIAAALAYMRSQFTRYGWQVRDQPCHNEELGDGVNLVATLPGVRTPDALVVVGAHHDTVPYSPGADDNSSGLAGLLELARLLGSRRWEATIELVAFDFEEHVLSFQPPYGLAFSGSRQYVASLRGSGRDLRGALVFEMIGYRSPAPGSQALPEGFSLVFPALALWLERRQQRADFIVALGDAESPLLGHVQRSCEQVAGGLPLLPVAVPAAVDLRDLFRSDHVPFWEAGFHAVMLTDTANFRNPHYHKPSDLPETLDAAFWRDVVAATFTAVAAMARPV